jgi:hypothetical protein
MTGNPFFQAPETRELQRDEFYLAEKLCASG